MNEESTHAMMDVNLGNIILIKSIQQKWSLVTGILFEIFKREQ
jgi:hypothetical protein